MYEGSKLSKRSFKDAWIKVFCGVSFFLWQKWFELDSVHPSLSAPAHMLSSYRLQYSCPVWKWTNLTSISNFFFIIINSTWTSELLLPIFSLWNSLDISPWCASKVIVAVLLEVAMTWLAVFVSKFSSTWISFSIVNSLMCPLKI